MTATPPPPPLPSPPSPANASSAATRSTDGRSNTLFGIVIVLALVTIGVLGLLWLGARGSVDDALTERDIALAERDAANAANVDAGTQ
ncbi:MAG: hypothetical protein ABJ314_00995, partial [Ilumatobacter sp.]